MFLVTEIFSVEITMCDDNVCLMPGSRVKLVCRSHQCVTP